MGKKNIIALEKTSNGNFHTFEYKSAYTQHSKAGYPKLSRNKLNPDFSDEVNDLYSESGKLNTVTIKATGRRYTRNGELGDFDVANKAAKLDETPEGYVWHHLDDFNPETGEITLQLIKNSAHRRTFPHTGSPKQWESYYGTPYEN